MSHYEEPIDSHYGRPELGTEILAALQGAGKDINALAPEDLVPIGEFHNRGLQATRELSHLAKVEPGMRILDIGCGIGGPARTLATEFGCHVTGLDITEEYCRVAEMLNQRVGLGDSIEIRHGSALALPFDVAAFDMVWTQHTSMNIEDKQKLFEEMHRVLKPGGRLAFDDVLAGPVQPIHFPVPWARDPSISFLAGPDEFRRTLNSTGFSEVEWIDQTETTKAWWGPRIAVVSAGGPPWLSVRTLLGPDFGDMSVNMLRNLKEERAVVVQGVFQRTN